VVTGFQNEIYLLQSALGDLTTESPDTELMDILTKVIENREALMEYYASIRMDVNSVDEAIENRSPLMSATDLARLTNDAKRWKSQLNPIFGRLEGVGAKLTEIQDQIDGGDNVGAATSMVVWMRQYLAITQEIVLLQARTRLQNVYLKDPIRLDVDCALKIAYANRLDYKNARSSLVDTWRLIEFNANRLKSDLTITASSGFGTVKDNIASFDIQNGNTRLGVQFDAPLTRLLERNNYRSALIEYQGSRRSFVAATDGINSTMRRYLRSLNELELNLEIQRRAVDIAIRRVEVTEAKLQEPPNPDDPNRFGPTDVQNLSSALADLRNTQNNLMSVWLNYYSTRMLLVRDLGVMELDPNGRWVDLPLNVEECLDDEDLAQIPPEIPEDWVEDAFEEEVFPNDLQPENPKSTRTIDYFDSASSGSAEFNSDEQHRTATGKIETAKRNTNHGQTEIRINHPKNRRVKEETMTSPRTKLSTSSPYVPFEKRNRTDNRKTELSFADPPETIDIDSEVVPVQHRSNRRSARIPAMATTSESEPLIEENLRADTSKDQPNAAQRLRWAHLLKSPTNTQR
jgi:hypothetical protein